MNPDNRQSLVAELVSLLEEGNAHVPFAQACADIPLALVNQHVAEVPYTIWQLAEHVRIAQWDIIEFCLDPNHKSPRWPDEYWPNPEAQIDEAGWQTILSQIDQDRARFIALLRDPAQNLLTPLPHGTGQTLLR